MNVWDVVDLILKVDMSDDPDPKNTFFFSDVNRAYGTVDG